MPRKYAPVLLTSLMLAACAGEGDLGRTRLGAFDHLSAFASDLAEKANRPGSNLMLTQNERQLRTLSQTLRQPKQTLAPLLNVASWVAGLTGTLEEAGYFQQLKITHPDSPISILNAFAAHVQDDSALIDQFAHQSVRVIKADGHRLNAVREAAGERAFEKTALIERAVNVIYRVEENGKVIDEAVHTLETRLASYEYALARIQLEIPAPNEIGTIEQAMSEMKKRLSGLSDDAKAHAQIVQSFFSPAPITASDGAASNSAS